MRNVFSLLVMVFMVSCVVSPEMAPQGAGDEASQWEELPNEWKPGVDYRAFCKPGEWTFLPVGKDLARCGYVSCPPQAVSVDRVFFKVRSPDWPPPPKPPVDRLTLLRIARSEAGEIAIQAIAGDVMANSQVIPVKQWVGLSIERPTECVPGRAWRFLSDVDGGWGSTYQEYASLALAADGSLLVRVEVNTTEVFHLKENTMRFYVRFPPAPVPGKPPLPR